MKRSKLTTFTVLVLLVTMVALIMVSGTYAKYTTTLSDSDTAVVAKFEVGGLEEGTFDLFATAVYDTETYSDTEDEDVANETIAPGTYGKFAITLTNDSDVSVSYTLALSEENDNDIPIEYSLDGETWYTDDNFSSVATDTMEIGSTTQQTATVTIWWRWTYEGTDSTNYTETQTDETDTALGEDGTATVKVTASVEFTQVD